MRKYSVILLCSMLIMFVSACASAPTITWTPKGNETTTLGLRTDGNSGTYLAVRAVDGQAQANPWTFYVPSNRKGQAPKVLGEGKDANVVEIEVNTDYELELGFFQSQGILEKNAKDWNDSRPTITLKALEAGKQYTFVVKERSQISIGLAPTPAGQKNIATLILRGGKGLFGSKVVQQWRIYTMSESGKFTEASDRKYMVEEEEAKNGLF